MHPGGITLGLLEYIRAHYLMLMPNGTARIYEGLFYHLLARCKILWKNRLTQKHECETLNWKIIHRLRQFMPSARYRKTSVKYSVWHFGEPGIPLEPRE